MNSQELATVVQYRLPVKVVVLNNGYLGMVRQWQEFFYGKRYASVSLEGVSPDFVKLAASYGIPARGVSEAAELNTAFSTASETNGPFLLDCKIDQVENVYPMVQPGTGNADFVEDPRGRARER